MHWIYAHLIGDFLLQTDWMAQRKKKSSLACTVHVLTYMLPFLFCGFSWTQLALIAVQHWIQDRTPLIAWFMKTKPTFSQPPLAPWSFVVVDQIIHILFMAWIASC